MIADLQKQLGIDGTLGVQFVIFIALFLWLRFVFFGPFLKLIEERISKTQGLKKESEGLVADAERKEAEYAAKISELKKQIAHDREKIISEARAKSAEILQAARAEAKTIIENSRKTAQTESDGSLKELGSHVKQLASMLVEKLTKEKVGL